LLSEANSMRNRASDLNVVCVYKWINCEQCKLECLASLVTMFYSWYM